MNRKNNRKTHELRPLKITPHVLKQAEGSVEIQQGNTKIICTASVETALPKWLKTPGMGWVSAEYGMLPRSTHTRMRRDRTSGSSRSQEISRLIARSLRAGINLKKLGERQIFIDCDVISADGGTRTAAVSGGFTAMALALHSLKEEVMIESIPLTRYVAGVSAGVFNNEILTDLSFEEDQKALADINLIFTSEGELVEIQGTAEKKPFSKAQLNEIIDQAWGAVKNVFKEQEKIIGSFFPLNTKAIQ